MRLKSIIAFFKWEMFKIYRPFQKWLDEKTWKPINTVELEQLFDKLSEEDTYFIQVGANDGVTGDKLHKYVKDFNWTGILIEPVPYIFKRLQYNYRDQVGLIFENCAIGKEAGIMPFYSISETNEKGIKHNDVLKGYGLDQLGSFDKKTLLKHSGMIPDFESFIKVINVPTLTVDDLILKHNAKRIDVLQVDTEGYDFEILSNINLENIQPKIIVFEHQHLWRSKYKLLIKKLRKKYHIFINGWDTVCIRKENIN